MKNRTRVIILFTTFMFIWFGIIEMIQKDWNVASVWMVVALLNILPFLRPKYRK